MRTLFVALSLLQAFPVFSQTSVTKYYSDEKLKKEVPLEKARFSQTVITGNDGCVKTETKNIKKDMVISSYAYKGDEPCGIWKGWTTRGTVEMDYDFGLEYSDTGCVELSSDPKDHFTDDPGLNYVAPRLATGEKSLLQFFTKEMRYPPNAADKMIMGRVEVTFEITETGQVQHIWVLKSAGPELDKETVRVLRKAKFTSPPLVNGKAQSMCVPFSINYKIQ